MWTPTSTNNSSSGGEVKWEIDIKLEAKRKKITILGVDVEDEGDSKNNAWVCGLAAWEDDGVID